MRTHRLKQFGAGLVVVLAGAGQAALATDYSGTLDFSSYSASVTVPVFGTIPVGIDLQRFDLGSALNGSGYNVTFNAGNFDNFWTMPVVVLTTDPNNALLNDPTALAGVITSSSATTFLNNNVTGWQYYAYGNVITPGGTTDLKTLFGGVNFKPGTHYYAFVGGGSRYTDSTLDYTLSVTAVPEPESWAMMLAGLGLVGAIARRNKKTPMA